MLKKILLMAFIFFGTLLQADWLRDENINQALEILDSEQDISELHELKKLIIQLKPSAKGFLARKKVVEKEFRVIRNILIENEISPIFAYITFAESNFQPKAKGYKTAGLWQLTKQSAKILGLKVSKKNDERLDMVKSTHAAIKQLKRLEKKYKKLYLADFAYGLGEGTLERILSSSRDDSIKNVWKNRLFKNGTKKHFAKIILLYCALDADSKDEELIQTGTDATLQEIPSSDDATTINQSEDLLKNP